MARRQDEVGVRGAHRAAAKGAGAPRRIAHRRRECNAGGLGRTSLAVSSTFVVSIKGTAVRTSFMVRNTGYPSRRRVVAPIASAP
eukprot:7091075-Prymnesium_polylepis.1